HARGRTIGLADKIAPAAHRLANEAEAGAVCVGAGLAVARDAHDDEFRIERVERFGAHAPFFQRTGPEVFDENVSLRDEIAGDLLALADAQVEGDGALVARDGAPPGGLCALPPLA